MHSAALMKIAKAGYLVMSATLCAAGVFLIVSPDYSVLLLERIFGILMIAFGAVKLIGYYSKDPFRLAFQHDLASGILLFSLGAVTIFRSDDIISFLGIILGIIIMSDGLLKIQTAADAKEFGIKMWWLILVLAAAVFLMGTTLLVRSDAGAENTALTMGLTLISESLLNLCTVLTAVKIVRRKKTDAQNIKATPNN